jgi:hypothetical protein
MSSTPDERHERHWLLLAGTGCCRVRTLGT